MISVLLVLNIKWHYLNDWKDWLRLIVFELNHVILWLVIEYCMFLDAVWKLFSRDYINQNNET